MRAIPSCIELSKVQGRRPGDVLAASADRKLRSEHGPSVSPCARRCAIPTLGNDRVMSRCRKLHCTRCDNHIIIFDGKEWRTECSSQRRTAGDGASQRRDVVSYMFLRNVYPSREKMKQRMRDNVASTAYACQCTVRGGGGGTRVPAWSLSFSPCRTSFHSVGSAMSTDTECAPCRRQRRPLLARTHNRTCGRVVVQCHRGDAAASRPRHQMDLYREGWMTANV